MKDILSKMGEVYTGAEINEWMSYHYRHNTPQKKHVINFLVAYGQFGIAHPNRLYRIEETKNYPKSSKAHGNRDGDYMLFRVYRRNRKLYKKYEDVWSNKPIRSGNNVFYL